MRARKALDNDPAYISVSAERRRQDNLWGEHGGMSATEFSDQARNLSILVEEVGEAAKEVNEWTAPGARERLRTELVQVAAVAVAWVQALDLEGEPPCGG